MAPLAVGKLKTRKIYTSKNQTPYRVRRKNEARPKLIATEKKKLREKRANHRTEYNDFLLKCDETLVELSHEMAEKFPGHSAEYYHQAIMQQARKVATQRKISPWNAFIHSRKQAGGEFFMYLLAFSMKLIAFVPDSRGVKAPQLSQQLRDEWNAMTPEQKAEATKESILEIQAQREERSTTMHNATTSAFNDTHANLTSIGQQVWPLSYNVLHCIHGPLVARKSPCKDWHGDRFNCCPTRRPPIPQALRRSNHLPNRGLLSRSTQPLIDGCCGKDGGVLLR